VNGNRGKGMDLRKESEEDVTSERRGVGRKKMKLEN
jgi:hypothetical protein